MADELQQTLDRVNTKAQILLERYVQISHTLAEAKKRIADLENSNSSLRAENEKLQMEVDYLKIATTLTPGRKDVDSTRALLSELVREIDKCITDLNE